ncbi:hypothetical protein SAMN02927924_00068 [Sphingobium faniae]|nr:hypothetical protein SAMN02927924_00068 [Sphingobium faniae]
MSPSRPVDPNMPLSEEERHMGYFLREVRPIGEEKSELYPEPQYFNLALMSGAVRLPETIAKIRARTGGAQAYAKRIKRVLSGTSAVQLTGIPLMMSWGREMLHIEEELAPGTVSPHTVLTDQAAADTMAFAWDVVSHYRDDFYPYASQNSAYGPSYRILEEPALDELKAFIHPVDGESAQDLLSLIASTRALSFLMEAETRDGLMMHGPYPASRSDEQIIVYECVDLHWSLFPHFNFPSGQKWELPAEPFPLANVAVALQVKGAAIRSDRFGTLYVDPLGPENVVAGALLTRGVDAFTDEELKAVPVKQARSLSRKANELQSEFFLQLAQWSFEDRLLAGAMEEAMLQLRMLSAAGFTRSEIEREQQEMQAFQDRFWPRFLPAISKRAAADIVFFQRLGEFAAGQRETMFRPFKLGPSAA